MNKKMDENIMNKNFFKTISNSALADYLGKFIWGSLRVGSPQSDLLEEAIKRLKKDIQGNITDKTSLDEHAPGIDGKNAICLAQCDENELRISGIFHLASVLGTDEMENSFHESIDDFVDHLFSETGHHESILPLRPEIPDDDQNFFKECLHDHWLNKGFFGFAIQVTTPVYENNMSSGWGYCRQQWFYAETYSQAFDLAMEWSRKESA